MRKDDVDCSSKIKHIEFSKIIVILVNIVNISVMIFTCVMVAITKDMSILQYLIPAATAELATTSAFYYSKSKMENKIKLMKSYGLDPSKDDFS